MERREINPWAWSVEMGFQQAVEVTGSQRTLYCSGQTSVDENGAPLHAGDMLAQVNLALDKLEAVLKQAGMTLANVVRLNKLNHRCRRLHGRSGVGRSTHGRGRSHPMRHPAGCAASGPPRADDRAGSHRRGLASDPDISGAPAVDRPVRGVARSQSGRRVSSPADHIVHRRLNKSGSRRRRLRTQPDQSGRSMVDRP